MPRYSLDPRWITARFASQCAGCGADIKKGEKIFYYPNGKKAYAAACCGGEQAADFNAAAFDEEVYGS